MTKAEEDRILAGFRGPFAHQRMRMVIYTKRMIYDYMELDRYEGDNCPTWLFSKVYTILQVKVR